MRSANRGNVLNGDAAQLPAEVTALAPRMHQIAAIIYEGGGATAKDIQAQLEEPITVNAIRTLLNRLCRRGIVKQRWSGRHREILYFAGIPTPSAKDAALNRLLTEHFDGSLQRAVEKLRSMCVSREAVSDVAAGFDRHSL